MERYRLKNIIILILALLNLCLLGILSMRISAELSSRRQAREQLVSLFAAAEISLDADLISDETPPASLTLTRDEAEEQSMAAYLLGGTPAQCRPGRRYFQLHRGVWSRSVPVQRRFSTQYVTALWKIPKSFCREFCKTYGYEEMTVSLDNGTGVVTAVQYYQDYPVVGCSVTFTLEGGTLKRAIGTHLPDSAATATAGEAPLSALSALTAFYNTIREGPWAPP